MAADVAAWLAGKLGPEADAVVTKVTVPESNGMSSETVLVDAVWTDSRARSERRLVFRVAPLASAVPVFQSYDLDEQFRTIAKVAELTDVPVPPLFWSEPDDAALGAPFFVMGRIDGDVPPDVLPYNFGDSWVADATPEQLSTLERSSISVLARLHGIESPAEHFDFLHGASDDSALRRHVDDLRGYYEWVTDGGERSPLIDRTFDWLDEHWPDDEGATVLSWGDARIGNVMYRDFEPVAVLDWEMAALAPREVDLAWMIFIHRFFEDIANVMELDGMPAFMRRDTLVDLYEAETGHRPANMDFYTVYAALRHAVVMSQVQRRAIAFGVAEMPQDIDDLIMHRATMEEMLAGTYWDRILD